MASAEGNRIPYQLTDSPFSDSRPDDLSFTASSDQARLLPRRGSVQFLGFWKDSRTRQAADAVRKAKFRREMHVRGLID